MESNLVTIYIAPQPLTENYGSALFFPLVLLGLSPTVADSRRTIADILRTLKEMVAEVVSPVSASGAWWPAQREL